MAEIKFDEKFQDQNTGETVTRIKVPEDLEKEITRHISANAESGQKFLQISRQVVGLQVRQKMEFDAATKSEQEIGKEVIRIREKMGLDSGWVYNIPMKMMEKREAPPETRFLDPESIK